MKQNRKSDLAIVGWSLQKAWTICPKKLVFWIAANALSAVLAPVYLLLSSYLIDSVSANETKTVSLLPFLIPIGVMVLFLFLRGSYRLLISTTKQLFIKDMQMEVSRMIMDQNARIPVSTFDDDKFVKMLYLCADSNNAVNTAVLAQGSITVLGQLVSILTLLAMAARISWGFFAATLALAAISTAVCMTVAKKRYRIEKDTIVDARWKNYYFSCPCTQENGREIRTLGLEDFFVKKWRSVADPLRNRLLEVEYSKNTANKALDALGILLATGMLAGGLLMMKGQTITLGTMYLIWQLSNELQSGIRGFSNELLEPFAAIPKVRDTQEYLDLNLHQNLALGGTEERILTEGIKRERIIEEGEKEKGTKREETKEEGTKEDRRKEEGTKVEAGTASRPVYQLKNVTFGYKPDKEILHQIDLDIRPGEIVALCGMNGCGKSTLINLMTGLYKADQGRIQFESVPFDHLTPKMLSSRMGVAFQYTCIFGFPLREETAMGEIEQLAQEDTVLRAIHRGGADKLCARIGLDGYVGTSFDVQGYRLSGGEQQRIGVSRAFMGDKPVLILDEPAAMLDPIAEYKQFQEIKGQIAGQTAILISHRIGFARLADRILVMENGRIAEDGTHEELIKRNGLYRSMFDAQSSWYDDVKDGGDDNA